MKLITPRLILRLLRNSDAPSIAENANDINIAKWLLALPHPYGIKDARNWIKINKKKWAMKKQDDYSFGIELKAEKRIIGGIGLHHVSKEQGVAVTGYWLGSKYHGKGYGTEALGVILKLAFGRLKLRRVEAEVFPGNPSSGKLLKHFGFKLEGMKRKRYFCKADKKIKDAYIYGLLKGEQKY